MSATQFADAERQQTSFLAPLEKRALLWLAARLPLWIGPDCLSLAGLLALALAGLFYYLGKSSPRYLLLVDACLALNWFGDSLDGTIARYRNRQRPRYGFYVDHIIDTFGAFFLVAGLALSGYMSERVAFVLLSVYFILSINSYLAAYSLNRFTISFWKFGPTEIRLVLGIGNIFLLYHPYSHLLGKTYLLYDVGGIVGIIGMSLMIVVSTITNTIALHRLERL